MVCLFPSSISVRRDGVIPLLLLNGMWAFSSAFLFQSNPCLPSAALDYSRRGQRHNNYIHALYVLTESIGTNTNMETEENYSLGKLDDDNDKKNILTFQSSFQRQSNPLPQLSPNIPIDDFLLHSDHLLSAGKSMHSKIVPTTSELFEEWTIACDRVGACPPNLDRGVTMSVRTAGISIPGLTVEWSALIGTNLVHRRQPHYQEQQQQHPELEFVLIKDESKVSSGAKPIVWIYNKLTQSRSNKNKRQKTSNVDTKLFARFGFYETPSTATEDCNSQDDEDDDKSTGMVIRCSGIMEMNFRIPSMLGKLIFSSGGDAQKAQAERKMSNLITRQIEKDTEKHVDNWEANFLSWIAANECEEKEIESIKSHYE